MKHSRVEPRPYLTVGTAYRTAMQAVTARMPQTTLSSTAPSPQIAPLQLLWLKYAGCSTGQGEASADTNTAAMPTCVLDAIAPTQQLTATGGSPLRARGSPPQPPGTELHKQSHFLCT